MDKDKLLKLVEFFASNPYVKDIYMDIAQGLSVTNRERSLAKVLSDIYRFVHGQGDCRHPDWQEEAEVVYNKAVKNGLI